MSPSLSSFYVRGPCTLLRRFALVACVALTCGASPGQAASGPRKIYDPPSPPDGSSVAQWQNVQIPLLPTGASLGALWTGTPCELYVWATEGAGTASQPPALMPHSMLLHWDGVSWHVALDVRGETGISIFGVSSNDVFAATSTASGAAKMYHFNGASWTAQALPPGTLAPAGAISGAPCDIYFRSASDVLRHDGSAWHRVFTSADPFANALAYIGSQEIYANCHTGHYGWDGIAWGHNDYGFFRNVGAAWGVRQFVQSAGVRSPLCLPTLSLYATGRSGVTDDFAVWSFVEDSPGTMQGQWVTVPLGSQIKAAQAAAAAPQRLPNDPGGPLGGDTEGLRGDGAAVWGSSALDVYAAGTQSGVGVLFHFDGSSWLRLTPLMNMPPVAGVWGSGPGNVWVSFKNGLLLHYVSGLADACPGTVVPGAPAALPRVPAAVPAMAGAAGMLETRVVRAGSGVVTFEYSVPKECDVSISTFDVTGRCIANVERGWRGAGRHQVDWNTAGLARGVYFYQVRAGAVSLSRRVGVLN